MKMQEKSGKPLSVEKKWQIQNCFGLKGGGLKPPMDENFVFIFWAAISFVTIYILMLDDRLVMHLSELNKLIQNDLYIFSNFNKKTIFDSSLANAHFLLMSLCIPIQLVMLFVIPSHRIAAGVQKKGEGKLLLGIFLFGAPLTVITILGPGVSIRYSRFIDENLIIALVDYAITIGFSYLIRIVFILLKIRIGVKNA